MKIHDYVKEIWDIAHEQNMDVGVAKDMFLTNVRLGENKYTGAKVDFAALQPNFVELEKSGNDYSAKVTEHYWELVAAYQEKRYEDMKAILG